MKGVSEVIGFMLITALLAAGAFMAVGVVREKMGEIDTQYRLDAAVSAMKKVRDALYYLSSLSPGSRVEVDVGDIAVEFSSDSDSAFSRIESKYQIIPPGTHTFISGVEIFAGADASGYENSTHVVLENSLVRVALRKSSVINTSEVIDYMLLKPDKVIRSGFGVRIGDDPLSMKGSGEVRLVTAGTGLSEAVAVASIKDPTAPYNYTVVFVLPSRSDYMKVYVRDIKKN